METITIECNDDGTYRVTSTEDESGEPGDKPLDQTVQSVDEVLQLVQSELSDDEDMQGKQAWDAEAQVRDAQGYRQPGGMQPGGMQPM